MQYKSGGALMNLTSLGLRLGGNTAGTRQSVEKSEVLAHEARDLIANMLDERAEERPSMQAAAAIDPGSVHARWF